MAEMADAETVKNGGQHPQAAVVAYVNTSAAVKAERYCCLFQRLKVVPPFRKKISFPIVTWAVTSRPNGENFISGLVCRTHHQVTVDGASGAKAHPEAKLLIHPECQPRFPLWPITSAHKAIVEQVGKMMLLLISSEQKWNYPWPKNAIRINVFIC